VQVMFQVEEEFDVYLADEDVGVDTQNVGQLLDAVEKLIQAKAA
jgi:acyl carrier protein